MYVLKPVTIAYMDLFLDDNMRGGGLFLGNGLFISPWNWEWSKWFCVNWESGIRRPSWSRILINREPGICLLHNRDREITIYIMYRVSFLIHCDLGIKQFIASRYIYLNGTSLAQLLSRLNCRPKSPGLETCHLHLRQVSFNFMSLARGGFLTQLTVMCPIAAYHTWWSF